MFTGYCTMSVYEYSDMSSEDSFDEERVLRRFKKKTTSQISKELNLYYSNLFMDTFNLIDLFVKKQNIHIFIFSIF